MRVAPVAPVAPVCPGSPRATGPAKMQSGSANNLLAPVAPVFFAIWGEGICKRRRRASKIV